MDSARLALEYLVAGNVSDALLARATRELLGRRTASRLQRGGLDRVSEEDTPPPAEPQRLDPSGLSTPPPVRQAPAVPEETLADKAGRGVQPRSHGIPGMRPELVRVNVRIEGRRTSLSFPKPEWAVLMRRYGGRQALLQATESFAAAFKGRGSRSAWVLDQLEARTIREGAQAAAQVESAPAPLAVAGEGTPSLFPELDNSVR